MMVVMKMMKTKKEWINWFRWWIKCILNQCLIRSLILLHNKDRQNHRNKIKTQTKKISNFLKLRKNIVLSILKETRPRLRKKKIYLKRNNLNIRINNQIKLQKKEHKKIKMTKDINKININMRLVEKKVNLILNFEQLLIVYSNIAIYLIFLCFYRYQ